MAVLGALNLRIVGGNSLVAEKQEGGASIGNTCICGLRAAGADSDRVGSEGPETSGAVNVGVGNLTGVFGTVDEAEIVATRCTREQISGKERLREALVNGVGEECVRLLGLD